MRNWDDVRVFLAVARAKGLSGAAPVLRMDPATVSRRVARLEAALGAALFVKSPQGYALTDTGQRVRAEAEAAEGPLARALEQGAADGPGLSGQVRIGAPDGCANFLLPQVCAALQRDHPDLELQVLALPRVVNLSQREADMAITVSPPAAGRLMVQKITDYHLHLAMHRDAPPPRALSDLKDHAIVGYIPDMIFDRELDYLGAMAADGVQLASNSVAVQLQMLRAGTGIGIVHDFALPFAPELRRVLTDAVSLQRSFYLVRHAVDRPSERLMRVAEALLAGLRAEVFRLEQAVGLTDEVA
ncbi:LysR family transcriptional regulator [Yoonia sp. R2331]|uniref:LysR family transcriptional regulator n=1 Tax=Yoonia sp. R2331 TaxID=3237238 RepID=UPI0034E5B8BD